MKAKPIAPSISPQEVDDAERQIFNLQSAVDYDTLDLSVEFLVAKFVADEYFIPPYQRKYVWQKANKSKFIESVLLGIPIPSMFFAEDRKTGKLEIIDGAQRIQTLHEFTKQDLALSNLDKLDQLEGFRFKDLSLARQRKLNNRPLRVIILSEKANIDVRFDLFERINTTSVNVNPSELRKGAFPGPFYDLLTECSTNQQFRKLCPVGTQLKKRGEYEELILRFFCYSERYQKFVHDVRPFLNEFLREKNELLQPKSKVGNAEKLKGYRAQFRRVNDFVAAYLPQGFAKTANQTPRVRFEAISVGVHLALEANPKLKPKNTDWLSSRHFEDLTRTDGSNSKTRLANRIEFVRDSLLKSRT